MKKLKRKKNNHQSGAAMLISVVFFLFISLAIVSGLISAPIREFRIAKVNLSSKQAYFLAESGGEDVFYRIRNSLSVSETEEIILGGNSVSTTMDSLPENRRQIISLADVSGYQRKTDITISADPEIPPIDIVEQWREIE